MASTSQQFDTLDGLVVTGDMSVGANLNVDSGTLFVDASTNRVGIGKTNPQYNLDIPGNAFIDTLTANNFNYVSISSINIDNLTFSGNTVESSSLLILKFGSTNAIDLDSGAGAVRLEKGSTEYGRLSENGGSLVIAAGASTSTALTLQADGDAFFAANVHMVNGDYFHLGANTLRGTNSGVQISSNTYHAGYLVHSTTDTDTHIKFNNNQIALTAGGSTVLSANSTIISTPKLKVDDFFLENVYEGTIDTSANPDRYIFNMQLGSVQTITAVADFHVDFSGMSALPASTAATFTLIVTNSGGTHEITWPGSTEDDAMYWAEGVEPPSSSGVDIYTFYYVRNSAGTGGTMYAGLALRKAGWAQ